MSITEQVKKGMELNKYKFSLFIAISIILIPVLLSLRLWWIYEEKAILIPIPAISLITYKLFDIDKRRAMLSLWRIPEANLLLFSAIGGWPGALIGQIVFRHKTKKQPFKLLLWIIIFAHIYLYYWIFKNQYTW